MFSTDPSDTVQRCIDLIITRSRSRWRRSVSLMVKEREMANPLTVITSLAGGKSRLSNEVKGVVKRDWVPTGRIDFASKLDSNDDPNQPSEFKLLVEERRIIESVAGDERLELQWRLATLKEAKVVSAQYHKYLTENSLIKSPEPKDKSA